MKLQIGSGRVRGKYRGKAWLNIDISRFDDVNVIGSGCLLPFADGAFEEIHCIHVLEHLKRDQYPVMLKEIHRVLEHGGSTFIEVPDIVATTQWLLQAHRDNDHELVRLWVTSIYGKSEVPGMSHHWGFYDVTLKKALFDAGFRIATRLDTLEDMISTHYQQEPILLVRGLK
jgi:predicted SAM-dependent methyltransferase